jgi:hypothetical protein
MAWAQRSDLGWGGSRNCMACKGQGFKSPQHHQERRHLWVSTSGAACRSLTGRDPLDILSADRSAGSGVFRATEAAPKLL